MMFPMKKWGMDSPRSIGKPITGKKKKVRFRNVSSKVRVASGFGTGVGQEENLEKERRTMIFFKSSPGQSTRTKREKRTQGKYPVQS